MIEMALPVGSFEKARVLRDLALAPVDIAYDNPL
jgi:hypothetical protein